MAACAQHLESVGARMSARGSVCACKRERKSHRESDRLQMCFKVDSWKSHGASCAGWGACAFNNPRAGWLSGSHLLIVKQTHCTPRRGGGRRGRRECIAFAAYEVKGLQKAAGTRTVKAGCGDYGAAMMGKSVKDVDRYQAVLNSLLALEENKFCADCESKGG